MLQNNNKKNNKIIKKRIYQKATEDEINVLASLHIEQDSWVNELHQLKQQLDLMKENSSGIHILLLPYKN